MVLHLPTVCTEKVVYWFRKDFRDVINRDVLRLHYRRFDDETKELYERGLFFQPLQSLYNIMDAPSANI